MAIYSCIAYPGSKRKCIDDIMELVPDGITDWREPFMGSLSVTLGFLQSYKSKDCKRFVVGDLAPEIWALWKGIQENPKEVYSKALEMFDKYMVSYNSFKTESKNPEILAFYEAEGRELWKYLQTVDTSKLSLTERAARTWVTNRISFSGMGDSGSLSVDRLSSFDKEHAKKILDVGSLLDRLEIINAPFQETMKGVPVDGGFIFLDPPYANQEKSGLYGRNGDTHKGFLHKEFAEFCKGTKAKWLITYDDSVVVRKLFRDKNLFIRPFKIPYTMAINSSEDALAGEELFIANYDIREKESFDKLYDFI